MDRKIQGIAAMMFITAIIFFAAPAALASGYETTVDAFTYNGYSIPAYDGDPSEIVNGNMPKFTDSEKVPKASIQYDLKDKYGRCTTCHGVLNKSLMPTWSRGSISSVYPTGWKQKKYDIIQSQYLYNRCHLIGWQLTGADLTSMSSNDLSRNLITGTRYLNVGDGKTGMLQYENQVAAYIKKSDANYIAYRVTPVFTGADQLARGVLMEGQSINTNDVKFCVFCYNVQPGIAIDYETGDSRLAAEANKEPVTSSVPKEPTQAQKKSIASCKGTLLQKTAVYSGKRISVSVKLTDAGKTLASGRDYSLSYTGNVLPGKARITITGKGLYTGSRQIYFKILPAKETVSVKSPAKKTMKITAAKQKGVNGYQFAYRKAGSSKWSYSTQKTNVKTIKKLKKKKCYEAKVRTYIKIDGRNHYGQWSSIKKCKIRKK